MITISLPTALLRHLATGLTESCLAKASHTLRLTPSAHKQLHSTHTRIDVRLRLCHSSFVPHYASLPSASLFSTLQKDAVSDMHTLICNGLK
ncbi:hypothetical protein BGW80DRAFT_1322057 [Lactifluus volemus]|nr:hypothetical protein BGW80DRAFT_1322057 [Lactifluus volemus]